MSQFKYERTGSEVTIQAEGDMEDVLAEIGFMLHKLHAGIKCQSPEAAMAFRLGMMTVVMPGSPTWQDSKPVDGESILSIVTKK